jgi:hypothetical protein
VSVDDLRQATRDVLLRWAESLFADSSELERRGYQSYVVLTICRMLYTLETGRVASKPQAVDWAKATLDEKWSSLVDRSWTGRQDPDAKATAEDITSTSDLMRYAILRSTRGFRV